VAKQATINLCILRENANIIAGQDGNSMLRRSEGERCLMRGEKTGENKEKPVPGTSCVPGTG
jgi:hypothetical protein